MWVDLVVLLPLQRLTMSRHGVLAGVAAPLLRALGRCLSVPLAPQAGMHLLALRALEAINIILPCGIKPFRLSLVAHLLQLRMLYSTLRDTGSDSSVVTPAQAELVLKATQHLWEITECDEVTSGSELMDRLHSSLPTRQPSQGLQ